MTDITFSNLLELAPRNTEHEMIKMKGFVIIINHRPKAQTVLVESYINHGMVDEEKNNMGISHLLEHICTDGWKRWLNPVLISLFDFFAADNIIWLSCRLQPNGFSQRMFLPD